MKKVTTSAQNTTTTQTQATPPQVGKPEISVESLLKDWTELQRLEKSKADLESQMKVITDRMSPAYRHLGLLLGQVQHPIKATRKQSTPRVSRGGGPTQLETAKGIVSTLPAQFTIDQFREGMGKAGMDANVHNILGKLKTGKVVVAVEGERGVFKKV